MTAPLSAARLAEIEALAEAWVCTDSHVRSIAIRDLLAELRRREPCYSALSTGKLMALRGEIECELAQRLLGDPRDSVTIRELPEPPSDG